MNSTDKLDKDMIEVSLTLSKELVQYMDENPYIGDYSKFIAWLIRRFQKEVEKSKREAEVYANNRNVFHDP